MKIIHLLNTDLPLTNEEHKFVEDHPSEFRISSLIGRDEVIARNLVRKGIYEISKNNTHLINKLDEKTS
jgi:hypothetical protein